MDQPARHLRPGFVVLCTAADGRSLVYGFEPRLEDAEDMVAAFLDERAAGEIHPTWSALTPRIVEGHVTWAEGPPPAVPDPLTALLDLMDPRTEAERSPE